MARQTIQNANASLYLDGNAGYLTVPITPAPTGFSFGMWVKTGKRTALSTGILISSNIAAFTDGFYLGRGNGRGDIEFIGYNSTNSVNTSLRTGNVSDGVWAHVVVTYLPSGACSIYLNGVLASTVTATNTITTGTTSIYVGKRSYNATYAGLNANNLVWHNTTSPWTAAQVLALYQQGTVPTGATAVYPLNEGGGTVAYDTSGNGNNGTITSGTWSRDTPSKTRKGVNGNMVYNGDFEIAPVVNVPQTTASAWIDGTATGSSTNNVFGWTVPGSGVTSSGTISFDTTVRKNGTKSIRLSALDATGTALAAQALSAATPTKQELGVTVAAVLPSTSYTLTCWAKTTNAAASSVYADIREHNGVGVQVITTPTNKLSGTNDWTQLTATVTTNAGTRFMGIILRNTGGGNISDAWFDDIQLYPTTAITRSAATGRLTATGRSAA